MDIAPQKVAEVIILAREEDRGEPELRAFVDRLGEEEQYALVAVFWIGRGSYEPEDLAEALATAEAEASVPTADYLLGSPHLADHLEAGLEALGYSVADLEDGLM